MIVDGKFACDACGKRYTWKPQLAGKKAKCACGAAMIVPRADAPQVEESDDLYGFAEEPLPAATVARAMPMVAPVAPAAGFAQPATPIGYRSAPTKDNTAKDRFSFNEATHPPRDLYIPVALLVLGLLGIIAWAASVGAGPVMIAVVSLITGVATLIKTAVLIGLAFLFAPMLGVSFGDARTAILKFAAIVIFTDAVGLWFEELVEMAGGMPSGRRGRGRIFWLEMFLIAGLISAMCYYLFDMDSEETGMFAIPFAVISRILDWVVSLVLGAIIAGMLVAAATPAAAPGPAAPAQGATSAAPGGSSSTTGPPAGPILQATDRDREIERLIAGNDLTDAVEFNSAARDRDKVEPQLVNQLYGGGAKRVYFGGGSRAVVQLPDGAANRAKCFQIAAAHQKANAIPVPAPTDAGQRYLEFELKKPGDRTRTR